MNAPHTPPVKADFLGYSYAIAQPHPKTSGDASRFDRYPEEQEKYDRMAGVESASEFGRYPAEQEKYDRKQEGRSMGHSHHRLPGRPPRTDRATPGASSSTPAKTTKIKKSAASPVSQRVGEVSKTAKRLVRHFFILRVSLPQPCLSPSEEGKSIDSRNIHTSQEGNLWIIWTTSSAKTGRRREEHPPSLWEAVYLHGVIRCVSLMEAMVRMLVEVHCEGPSWETVKSPPGYETKLHPVVARRSLKLKTPPESGPSAHIEPTLGPRSHLNRPWALLAEPGYSVRSSRSGMSGHIDPRTGGPGAQVGI
ncbi:hypothetical protein PG984_006544 [Apiospora sp. TS-2023a]